MLRKIRNFFFDLLTKAVPSKLFDPDMGQWAVIVIDMQNKYLKELHPKDRSEIISNQLIVIEYCRLANIPVVVLQYKDDGQTIKRVRDATQGLARVEFITKSRNNGFSGTNLAEKLRSWGVKTILLMGINASFCVKQTAEGALRERFEIATSGALIANYKERRKTKSATWFARNGLYKRDCRFVSRPDKQ